MRRLTLADIERLRRVPGRTVLFYITDRCPVGCAHCSVAARLGGPRVTDYPLFAEMVAGISAEPDVQAVAISGGEPFTERRGLGMAMDAFTGAGKDVVIFSSGHWASGHRCPRWIANVLARTSTVILSTDSFHQATVGLERFGRALGHVAEAGCHIVAQVLDEPGGIARVRAVLRSALGQNWADRADVKPITPLRAGRGREVFPSRGTHAVAELGPCPLTASPTVRYDGAVTGCCNETVIAGGGPAGLRMGAGNAAEVRAALARFSTDPLLRAMGSVPPRAWTALPPFAALAGGRYESLCDLCRRAHDTLHEDDDRGRRLLTALTGHLDSREAGT